MADPTPPSELEAAPPLELSEADIYAAMERIPGYLDITPGDFQDLYKLAFQLAWERLYRATVARDLMTTDVAAVRQDTPLAEVATLMAARSVSGVPVLDDQGRVVGVISEQDFLKSMEVPEPRSFMRLVAQCLASRKCLAMPVKQKRAGDLMTAPAVCIGEETPLGDIIRLFATRKINRAPVTDPEGRLLGLVSRADLLKAAMPGVQP